MKVLFRKSLAEKEEFDAAAKFFDVVESRLDCNTLTIPRYSSLPYYNELERDVQRLGGTLINSYEQHKWIANFDWYTPLRQFTFDTWDSTTIYKAPQNIRYVVKGKTNSRKWQWNTKMFARNRDEAVKIGAELYSDGLIGYQGIIYRRYEPLKTIEEGINGLPFSNEYRFFYYKDRLISSSFYWSIADQPIDKVPKDAADFANKIAKIASNYTNFFVLDVAERECGGWVLVEVNCGTMSGLSLINEGEFYANLKLVLS